MSTFFYDSYAIIEYINTNPHFIPYFEEHNGFVSLLNILEVYYKILQKFGKEKAEVILNILFPIMILPNKTTIARAMAFRLENKENNLSYADCLGYQIALDRGIKFLTGDYAFKKLPNVLFLN